MANAPSATVVVLDVGKGMDGRSGPASYLEQALQAVSLLVETKVSRRYTRRGKAITWGAY